MRSACCELSLAWSSGRRATKVSASEMSLEFPDVTCIIGPLVDGERDVGSDVVVIILWEVSSVDFMGSDHQ
jgi:hypothetical protein